MKTTKINKFCQSCGMPISKDPKKSGTNGDMTKNNMYCSYCYVKGAFTFKGTVKDMQVFCKAKMVEQGSSKFMAWLFTRNIPHLSRWKK